LDAASDRLNISEASEDEVPLLAKLTSAKKEKVKVLYVSLLSYKNPILDLFYSKTLVESGTENISKAKVLSG